MYLPMDPASQPSLTVVDLTDEGVQGVAVMVVPEVVFVHPDTGARVVGLAVRPLGEGDSPVGDPLEAAAALCVHGHYD